MTHHNNNCLKEYKAISTFVIGKKGWIAIAVLSLIFCIVPFLNHLGRDFTHMITLIIVTFSTVFSIIICNVQYSVFKSIGNVPFKSERIIKFLFNFPQILIILFLLPSAIIYACLGNIRMSVLYVVLLLLLCIFMLFVADGSDPQRQDTKIAMLIGIIVLSGFVGGLLSVGIGYAIDVKNMTLYLIITGALIAVMLVFYFIARQYRFKKYLNNIME